MVIDTSVVVAILTFEPYTPAYLKAISEADSRSMSVASFLEASMVIGSRFGEGGLRDLDYLMAQATIECRPVDLEQARVARDAFMRFGKGRHRAGLNYGDCFSYALTKVLGESLLCKGDDFVHTDVRRVEVD